MVFEAGGQQRRQDRRRQVSMFTAGSPRAALRSKDATPATACLAGPCHRQAGRGVGGKQQCRVEHGAGFDKAAKAAALRRCLVEREARRGLP